MSYCSRIFSLYGFLFFIFIVNAQEYQEKNQYYLFLDAKTSEIKIIENDSIIYTNNFQNPQKLKKGDYPENLLSYPYQFTINNKNYFVNGGGGVVLEYSKDSLRRIDNSFLHKNQFHAADFMYKNEIYLFGGYGLFSYKNFISRYDFKAKEWFQVGFNSKKRPVEGSSYCKIVIGDDLFVFGGEKIKEIGIGSEYIKPPILWKFNLKNATWEEIGQIDLKKIDLIDLNERRGFNLNNKIYILEPNYLAIIDIKNNKITYYKSKLTIPLTSVVYNPKDKTINFLENKSSTRKTVLVSVPLSDYFSGPIEEEPFYHSPYSVPLKLGSALGIIALVMLTLFKFKKINKKPNKQVLSRNTKLIVYTKNEEFLFDGISLEDLSENEKNVLKHLIENIHQYIPIHNLNFIIEKEMSSYSINTILRKRENILNSIKTKISILLNVPFNEIILEQKNIQDKRIKEIKLNDQLFKIE